MPANSSLKEIPSQIFMKTLLRNRRPAPPTTTSFALSVTSRKLPIPLNFSAPGKSFTSRDSVKRSVPFRSSWIPKTSTPSTPASISLVWLPARNPAQKHEKICQKFADAGKLPGICFFFSTLPLLFRLFIFLMLMYFKTGKIML